MTFTIDNVKAALLRCSARVAQNRDRLERVDSAAGDGDLGISMAKASEAVEKTVLSFPEGEKDLGKLFGKCALAVNSAAPSTMGTLVCAALMQLGRTFSGHTAIEPQDIARIPGIMAEAIMKRGKASEGDRTVLDALLPLSRAFESAIADGKPLFAAVRDGAAAAAQGLENTKTMAPRIGRAKWTPENAAGNPDGGAMLCSILADSFVSSD